jgi:hypothetical protein
MASTRSSACVLPASTTLPASIGPPETKTVGMLRRMAAISMPGVILSQLEMQTMASAQCALTMYSTLSAISSRDGQRIEHAVMAHGDAVVDGDGVEFLGDAAGLLDLARDQLAEVLQMHVARHELGEGVDHRDDRLAEILVLHAGGAPEAASAGHVAAVGGGAGASFEPLLHEALVLALPSRHRLTKKTSQDLRAFSKEDFIVPPRSIGPGLYDLIISRCYASGFVPRITQQARQMQTVISLVSAGMGVALVPSSVQNLKRTGVQYAKLKGASSVIDVGILKAQNINNQLHDHFIATLKFVARRDFKPAHS